MSRRDLLGLLAIVVFAVAAARSGGTHAAEAGQQHFRPDFLAARAVQRA